MTTILSLGDQGRGCSLSLGLTTHTSACGQVGHVTPRAAQMGSSCPLISNFLQIHGRFWNPYPHNVRRNGLRPTPLLSDFSAKHSTQTWAPRSFACFVASDGCHGAALPCPLEGRNAAGRGTAPCHNSLRNFSPPNPESLLESPPTPSCLTQESRSGPPGSRTSPRPPDAPSGSPWP